MSGRWRDPLPGGDLSDCRYLGGPETGEKWLAHSLLPYGFIMKLATEAGYANVAIESSPGLDDSLGVSRTIRDLQRENARLRRTVAELESYRNLAYRDGLTSLWNRRYFDERMNQEVSLARRHNGRRFSLLNLDLNDLKKINDEIGHAAGDQALKRAAGFLKSRLREHDVCCRVGGDEFAVILRDLGPEECQQLLTRLRGELQLANVRRTSVPISFSMGTASFPADCNSAKDLCLRADEAMYADKRAQKSRVTASASAEQL